MVVGSIVVTKLSGVYTPYYTPMYSPQYCTVQWCTAPPPLLLSSQLQRKNVDTSIPPHTSQPRPPSHCHHLNIFYLHYRLRHRALTDISRTDLCSEMSVFSDISCLDTFVFIMFECYLIHQAQQPERILSLYKLFFSWITINNNECPVKTMGCHFNLKYGPRRYLNGMEIIY